MSEYVGYRWTIIAALAFLIGFIFIPFYGLSNGSLQEVC